MERSGRTRRDAVRTDTGPFALIPEWVLDAEISDRAVRLYAVLGRYADNAGESHPSRTTLAKRVQCSRDSIDRAIRELEGVGALSAEPRYEDDEEGGRRQTSNLYTILRLPGRTVAEGGGGTPAAPPSRTAAAQNENQVEREPVEREKTLAPAAREYDPLKGQKIDGRNLPWDALVEETQADEKAEAGRIAAALKKIRELAVAESRGWPTAKDAELYEKLIAFEIRRRAELYRQRWPRIDLTPTALAAQWARVTTDQPGRSSQDAYEIAARARADERRRLGLPVES